MKIFESHPATEKLHQNWIERIDNEFDYINFTNDSNYLSIISYLDKNPQRFYSRIAFEIYLNKLNEFKLKDKKLLSDILKDTENQISLSNNILKAINDLEIHDIHFLDEHHDLINFIDKSIHYNLLKLYETPLYYFSFVLATFNWLKDGKKTDGLDLYNSIENLKKNGFDFLQESYRHTVRNGIAHGKAIYSDHDIIYYDKRGNKETLRTKEIIKVFDRSIDVVNGFCLAYKVFCFSNSEYFSNYKIQIPQSILLEELQAKANAPAWKIYNTLDGVALEDRKQLIIYVRNDNWDFNKVQGYSYITVGFPKNRTV